MGEINYIHKELAGGRWKELSLCEQMGNIGSEVHWALKWREKNLEEFCDFFYGDNEFHTDPVRLMKYYDYFAMHRGAK